MTLRDLIEQSTHRQNDAKLLDYEIQINNLSAIFSKNIVDHVHGTKVGMKFIGSRIDNGSKKIVIELEMEK